MNTNTPPLDNATRLKIAEYTLGTLYGNDENEIREIINNNDEAVHLALHWETVLLAMADRLIPVAPEPLVLARVLRTLGLPRIDPEIQPLSRPETRPGQTREPVKMGASGSKHTPVADTSVPAAPAPVHHLPPSDLSENVTGTATQPHKTARREPRALYTRPTALLTAAIALAAAGLLAYTALRPGSSPSGPPSGPAPQAAARTPESLFIAILQPVQSSSTPAWVILKNGPQYLAVEPRLRSEVGANEALALWTRNPETPDTHFLGWLTDTGVNQVAIPEQLRIGNNQLFEITLEKQGKNTSQPPEGEVLFIGQAVTATLPDLSSAPQVPPR